MGNGRLSPLCFKNGKLLTVGVACVDGAGSSSA